MATVQEIDALLPQTQCKECGFSGCLPYAEALAQKTATINKCPPGGVHTLQALGSLLKVDPKPFIPESERQTRKPALATIKEAECIGCTKCISACPVDAIIGSPKHMHSILSHECTGCGLCIEPCPVDCIEMIPLAEHQYNPIQARARYQAKKTRLLREEHEKQQSYRAKKQLTVSTETIKQDLEAKKNYIHMALARVQAKKS